MLRAIDGAMLLCAPGCFGFGTSGRWRCSWRPLRQGSSASWLGVASQSLSPNYALKRTADWMLRFSQRGRRGRLAWALGLLKLCYIGPSAIMRIPAFVQSLLLRSSVSAFVRSLL